jgi:hypothetical protein
MAPGACQIGDEYSWLDTSYAIACGQNYDGLIFYMCYQRKSGDLNEHDYDCDGSPDNEDPTPGEPDPSPQAEIGDPGFCIL